MARGLSCETPEGEERVVRPLIDLIVEWDRTKSIETANEICERMYKRMVWSEDDEAEQ